MKSVRAPLKHRYPHRSIQTGSNPPAAPAYLQRTKPMGTLLLFAKYMNGLKRDSFDRLFEVKDVNCISVICDVTFQNQALVAAVI